MGKTLLAKGQFRSVFEEKYTASTSVQESQEADKDIALVKSWLEANERPSFEDIRYKCRIFSEITMESMEETETSKWNCM